MSDDKLSDENTNGIPLDSDDAAEIELWDALGTIEAQEPSAQLRQGFYQKLEDASRPTTMARLRDLLGFSGNMGWLTAAVCVLVGLGTGQMLEESGESENARLVALEQNVSMLSRTLILDRLDNDQPGKRLRGVLDAAFIAADDTEIANALLLRATDDRVRAVRVAAIDALGSNIGTAGIGQQIMDSIPVVESPVVQLALIDLVLRNGDREQLEQLLKLAEDGLLFPDLSRHVLTSLKRDTA
jgi:hypothetical protein